MSEIEKSQFTQLIQFLKVIDSFHDFAQADRAKLENKQVKKIDIFKALNKGTFDDDKGLEITDNHYFQKAFISGNKLTADNTKGLTSRSASRYEEGICKFLDGEWKDSKPNAEFIVRNNLYKDSWSSLITKEHKNILKEDGCIEIISDKTSYSGNNQHLLLFTRKKSQEVIDRYILSKFEAGKEIIYDQGSVSSEFRDYLFQNYVFKRSDASLWDSMAHSTAYALGKDGERIANIEATNLVFNTFKPIDEMTSEEEDRNIHACYCSKIKLLGLNKNLKARGEIYPGNETTQESSSGFSVSNLVKLKQNSDFDIFLDNDRNKPQKEAPNKLGEEKRFQKICKKNVEYWRDEVFCNALDYKRSGDWGQVAYAKANGTLFMSGDLLACLYAMVQKCPFIYTGVYEIDGHKYYKIVIDEGNSNDLGYQLRILKRFINNSFKNIKSKLDDLSESLSSNEIPFIEKLIDELEEKAALYVSSIESINSKNKSEKDKYESYFKNNLEKIKNVIFSKLYLICYDKLSIKSNNIANMISNMVSNTIDKKNINSFFDLDFHQFEPDNRDLIETIQQSLVENKFYYIFGDTYKINNNLLAFLDELLYDKVISVKNILEIPLLDIDREEFLINIYFGIMRMEYEEAIMSLENLGNFTHFELLTSFRNQTKDYINKPLSLYEDDSVLSDLFGNENSLSDMIHKNIYMPLYFLPSLIDNRNHDFNILNSILSSCNTIANSNDPNNDERCIKQDLQLWTQLVGGSSRSRGLSKIYIRLGQLNPRTKERRELFTFQTGNMKDKLYNNSNSQSTFAYNNPITILFTILQYIISLTVSSEDYDITNENIYKINGKGNEDAKSQNIMNIKGKYPSNKFNTKYKHFMDYGDPCEYNDNGYFITEDIEQNLIKDDYFKTNLDDKYFGVVNVKSVLNEMITNFYTNILNHIVEKNNSDNLYDKLTIKEETELCLLTIYFLISHLRQKDLDDETLKKIYTHFSEKFSVDSSNVDDFLSKINEMKEYYIDIIWIIYCKKTNYISSLDYDNNQIEVFLKKLNKYLTNIEYLSNIIDGDYGESVSILDVTKQSNSLDSIISSLSLRDERPRGMLISQYINTEDLDVRKEEQEEEDDDNEVEEDVDDNEVEEDEDNNDIEKYTFEDGTEFIGSMDNDGNFISGTLIYLDGNKFKGDFKHSKIYNGIYTYENGDVFKVTKGKKRGKILKGGSLDDKIDHLEKFIINEGDYELPEYILDDIDKIE